MLTQSELDAIQQRNSTNPDVISLLGEIASLKDSQRAAIGWIGRDVLPAMKNVWRYLLYQKRVPEQCLVLDNAIARLEGDLGWLSLHS